MSDRPQIVEDELKRAAVEIAELREKLAEQDAEIERLRGEVERANLCEQTDCNAAEVVLLNQEIDRLRAAGRTLVTYGLPPRDVSGSAAWVAAAKVFSPLTVSEEDER